jgi:1,2-diacylglycerol 3-beta-glucosyltransferase
MIVDLLAALLTALSAGLLLVAGYVLLLTLAAFFGRTSGPPESARRRRFAILVPAHNEELLIGRLIENLQRLDYPKSLFHFYVVADNCDDRTAAQARSRGARVYERSDQTLQGKGHALRWLLQQIREAGQTYDAFIVLDADSVVSANFLRRMDARLQAGSQVIQAYYSVLNAADSPVAALRYAALAALHYLRPLGRSALGLSCGLKGNGMCFSAPIMERFDWNWFTLAEDVEFHLALVRAGIRVDFAPEATVLADMPTTLQQAESQNARWERGRLDFLRRQVPVLLREGLRQRSWLRVDAAIEQLIPPLSVPFALGALCLVLGFALSLPLPTAFAALSLAGQVGYLLTGLALVKAPAKAYLALSYAPIYVTWKVALYARAFLGMRNLRWIRTARGAS